jgi:nucleoside-diphosphate-sugar epimerase
MEKISEIEKNLRSVLVIGGCGYVGSRLVPKLLESGYEISVIDWMMYGNHLPFDRHLTCYRLDIRQHEDVRRIIERIRPDAVIDLASISNDPMGDLVPSLTESVNIGAQKNLIDACEAQKIHRFIFASSSSVYGVNDDQNIVETTPLAPVSLYSETKARVEEYLKMKTSESFITTCLRPATVCGYSPRQRLDLIVNLLVYRGYFEGSITIEGGERIRPHIHIDDMVNAYLSVLSADEKIVNGKIYNCGAETMSLLELGKRVKNHVGCDVKTIVGPDKRSHSLNSELIKNDIGFSFKHGTEDAIKDMIFAFTNHLINKEDPALFNMAWYKTLFETGKIML